MPYITSRIATWTALIFLLSIHIGTNYAAVRAVKMTTLNRQRSNILFSAILGETRILSPAEVAKRERIFEWDGALRWQTESSSQVLGSCRIGISLQELLCFSSSYAKVDLPGLLAIFEKERYLLWFDGGSKRAAIALKVGATPSDQLKAWWHALLVSKEMASQQMQPSADKTADKSQSVTDSMHSALEESLRRISELFDLNVQHLKPAGWIVDSSSLETSLGRRLEIQPTP